MCVVAKNPLAILDTENIAYLRVGIATFMPKETYYEDIKILKKPIKQRIKSWLVFFGVVVVGVGCFVIARYLSSALTVGNLGSYIVFGDTKLKYAKSSLYAVTMGEYEDKSECEKVALGSSVQGAGGFVWEDGKYYVVGNVYSGREDAERVLENLKETQYKTAIKQIDFPAISLDFDMYVNDNMDCIKGALGFFDEMYKVLYDYSIRFDKGEVTNLAVSSGLSECRGKLKSTIVQMQNLLSKSDSKLSTVQSALIMLDELLDQTIIKTIDNSATNHSLKYSIVSVVRIKYDLFKAL